MTLQPIQRDDLEAITRRMLASGLAEDFVKDIEQAAYESEGVADMLFLWDEADKGLDLGDETVESFRTSVVRVMREALDDRARFPGRPRET